MYRGFSWIGFLIESLLKQYKLLDKNIDCIPLSAKKACGTGTFYDADQYFITVVDFDSTHSPINGLLSAKINHFSSGDWVLIEAPLSVLESKTGKITAIYGLQ